MWISTRCGLAWFGTRKTTLGAATRRGRLGQQGRGVRPVIINGEPGGDGA